MRAIHRIRVDGTTAAADRLREYLHRASFLLVPDSSAGYTITIEDGPALTLDSVDSLLEQRIEANLEDLETRFPGCGAYVKRRAGGNQDPDAAIVTAPPQLHEGVALAIFRAILQSSEQAAPEDVPIPAFARTSPWWQFWK